MEFKNWMESQVVTFDFDSTLTNPEYDDENELWISDEETPNVPNCKKLLELHKRGFTVYIVTARDGCMRAGVEAFIAKHKLPVKGIFCCGGDKGQTLASLNSILHFDDMPQNLEDSKGLFKGKWVKVPHPLD